MTEQEERLQKIIRTIAENDLKELWVNHKINSHKDNGYVNKALIQKIRKIINNRLRELEK